MKSLFIATIAAFGLGLAVVIGSRLPVSAITVIGGVGYGVLASIPTSLLIVAVTHRRESQPIPALSPVQSYPPVVVVNSPPNHFNGAQGWPLQQPSWNTPAPVPRQFHMIGQDSGPAEGNYQSNF